MVGSRLARFGSLLGALLLVVLPSAADAKGDEIVAIGAGDNYFECALRSDHTVWCWGDNDYLELGADLTSDFETRPVQVKLGSGFLKNVVRLGVGGYHSCVVRGNGTVACFGDNSYGQLGTGDTSPVTTAAVVPGLTDVVAVAGGYTHSCALKKGGTVWCWGTDNAEALGNAGGGDSFTPVQVQGPSGPLTKVRAISAQLGTTCALLASGRLRCWGANDFHQLTNGTTDPSGVAVTVKRGGSPLDKVTRVEVGYGHVCAIRAGGQVWCWGKNTAGQIGDGTTDEPGGPVRMRLGSGFVKGATRINAGDGETCLVAGPKHIAYCVGDNGAGQLGAGSPADHHARPVKVVRANGSPVVSIGVAAGSSTGCVLRSDRAVFCMGDNEYGSLGTGGDTSADKDVATRVRFP